jgi:hypothetical protein
MELLEETKTRFRAPKVIAAVIFIALPFIAFFLGMTYQSIIKPSSSQNDLVNVSVPKTSTSSASDETATASAIPSSVYQKTAVNSPDKYGFVKEIKLDSIGIKAKFPQDVTISLSQQNFYTVKVGQNNLVTFALKDYDGGGRRAWFQKEYENYSDYTFESFNGTNHRGYVASSKSPTTNKPGEYFYFAAANSGKMLVVNGTNNPSGTVFFGEDREKFKSFLSTIELIPIVPKTFSDYFRWSDQRKTVWEDADLGIKITTPEWTETRVAIERDINGNWIYREWERTYPETKIFNDTSYYSEKAQIQVVVIVTGAYLSDKYLYVLSSFQGKTLSEVVNSLLLPSGDCAEREEREETMKDPADVSPESYNYYYVTKESVRKNLELKKESKLGNLDAQLRGLNEKFNQQYDCRAEKVWLIKGKNGQFIISNIDAGLAIESFRLEAI